MSNLIAMLRELDLEKNSIEDIRNILQIIANELEKKQKTIISFIKSTEEYYFDGVNEEIIDMIR